MAYSDYGAFVYKNGIRRTDKEDVGVFDTDESVLPSGARIFANIIKNREKNNTDLWNHSHHGVLGDMNIRVACYKQGFPTIFHWKKGEEKPNYIGSTDLIKMFGWYDKPFVCYYTKKNGEDEYFIEPFEYPTIKFEYENHKFIFSSTQDGDHYEAKMIEPDGTEWICEYDYGFGAGF